MNLQMVVVRSEAQMPEFDHEMTDPRTGGANDVNQRFLANPALRSR
jgi:hypothetical protein